MSSDHAPPMSCCGGLVWHQPWCPTKVAAAQAVHSASADDLDRLARLQRKHLLYKLQSYATLHIRDHGGDDHSFIERLRRHAAGLGLDWRGIHVMFERDVATDKMAVSVEDRASFEAAEEDDEDEVCEVAQPLSLELLRAKLRGGL